jgi:hypothetical protein
MFHIVNLYLYDYSFVLLIDFTFESWNFSYICDRGYEGETIFSHRNHPNFRLTLEFQSFLWIVFPFLL